MPAYRPQDSQVRTARPGNASRSRGKRRRCSSASNAANGRAGDLPRGKEPGYGAGAPAKGARPSESPAARENNAIVTSWRNGRSTSERASERAARPPPASFSLRSALLPCLSLLAPHPPPRPRASALRSCHAELTSGASRENSYAVDDAPREEITRDIGAHGTSFDATSAIPRRTVIRPRSLAAPAIAGRRTLRERERHCASDEEGSSCRWRRGRECARVRKSGIEDLGCRSPRVGARRERGGWNENGTTPRPFGAGWTRARGMLGRIVSSHRGRHDIASPSAPPPLHRQGCKGEANLPPSLFRRRYWVWKRIRPDFPNVRIDEKVKVFSSLNYKLYELLPGRLFYRECR